MNIEHTGSARIQPKARISSAEMTTPTLPSVSAKMCNSTPFIRWFWLFCPEPDVGADALFGWCPPPPIDMDTCWL